MAGPITTGDLVTATWLTEVERREPTGATVATSQAKSGTTFVVDLATVGPAVTVTTGTSAMVYLYTTQSAGGLMGFTISGATTVAASDAFAVYNDTGTTRIGAAFLVTGLTAGSNTFTARYRSGSGASVTWSDRKIVVIPFD